MLATKKPIMVLPSMAATPHALRSRHLTKLPLGPKSVAVRRSGVLVARPMGKSSVGHEAQSRQEVEPQGAPPLGISSLASLRLQYLASLSANPDVHEPS